MPKAVAYFALTMHFSFFYLVGFEGGFQGGQQQGEGRGFPDGI